MEYCTIYDCSLIMQMTGYAYYLLVITGVMELMVGQASLVDLVELGGVE